MTGKFIFRGSAAFSGLVVAAMALASTVASAQDGAFTPVPVVAASETNVPVKPKKERKPPKLPQTGLLSTYGNVGRNNMELGEPWGGTKLDVDVQPPIIGSISQAGPMWRVTVRNNSQDYFTLNLSLEQVSMDQRVVKTDAFMANLPPGGSATREYRAGTGSVFGLLKVRNWSWKAGASEEEEDEESADQEAGKE